MRNYEMKDLFILLSAACLCRIISTQNDVRLPPYLVRRPREKNVFYGDGHSFILECGAKGTPAVRYEWKKNGLKFNFYRPETHPLRNGKVYVPDGTMQLYGEWSEYEGYFQCFAENQYGSVITDMIHVRWSICNSYTGPLIVLRKIVVEGMPFHIQADREECFPKPSYYWSITGTKESQLSPTKRVQIAENGDLHFAYALPEDGERYKHLKHNRQLSGVTSNRHTIVVVIRNSEGNISQSAPTLAFSSETETVALVGESATLRCFFYGYPESNVSWVGPMNTFPTGRRFLLTEFETRLEINNITASDEGEYSCIGSNAEGNRTHTLRIRVEAAPKFPSVKDGPYDVNVTEGESVTFDCNAFAKPQAINVWLKNGKPIDTNNPPKRFLFSKNNKRLTIRNVCRDCVDQERPTDLMVIQCNASNVHGYDLAQGYLNVLWKTRVAISGSKRVFVDFLKRREFVFQCNVTADPSTPPTLHWNKTEPYGDLVRNEPPYVYVKNEFLIIMFPPNCSSACAKYLGEYRCSGYNGHSREIRSITITYQYRPEAFSRNEEETWASWKMILGAGAVALVLFLLGIFLGFLSNRRSSNVKRRMKNRRVPDPPCRHEDVEYESGGTLLEAVGNNERSMRRESSIYEQIGYASIGQVLQEITRKGRTTSHSSDVHAYGRYESMDAPRKESISRFGPRLDEDDMYDDTRCSVSAEGDANRGKRNEKQIKGCESTQSGSDKFPNSNEQLEATNTCQDVSREEVNSYLELCPTEDGPYLDLSPKEINPYLNMDRKVKNPYPKMDQNEVKIDQDEVNPSLEEDNRYLGNARRS